MINFERYSNCMAVTIAPKGFVELDEIKDLIDLSMNFIKSECSTAYVLIDLHNLKTFLNDLSRSRIVKYLKSKITRTNAKFAFLYGPELKSYVNGDYYIDRHEHNIAVFTSLDSAKHWLLSK